MNLQLITASLKNGCSGRLGHPDNRPAVWATLTRGWKQALGCLGGVAFLFWLGASALSAAEVSEVGSSDPDPGLALLRKLAEEQRNFLQRAESRLQDAQADANKNSAIILQRVQQLEVSLAEQKKHEVQLQQEFNRTFLVCLVVFALLAVIGLAILSLTIMTAARRTSEVITALASHARQLPLPLLTEGMPGVPQGQSTQRFIEAMSRLEARLEQVERTSAVSK